MRFQSFFHSAMVTDEGLRFIVVGIGNTLFGYLFGIASYKVLSPFFHIILIGLLSSCVSIIVSVTTQRLWVFRVGGPWLAQLRRGFVVYGAISVIGILLLWPLIELFGLSIWLAQGMVLVVCAGLSYVGQKLFTFRAMNS
jgi:putative flippase GtrA